MVETEKNTKSDFTQGVQAMKKNVKQKAKKQIEDLIGNLKSNEFLKRPGIQTLIEKVSQQKDINQKVEKVVNSVRNDVVSRVEAPVKKAKRAVQRAESAVRKAKSTSPKQLLNLITTSDVANRIAKTILSGAENINQKWLETVAGSRPTQKKAQTKAAAKTKTTKKPAKVPQQKKSATVKKKTK